jgi:MFS family permease
LWSTYDWRFLVVFGLQYFNAGLHLAFNIAYQYMYKEHYNVSPDASQIYQAIILSPWVLKLLYGAICDTIPIFGTRKRWWMILMGLLQFSSLFAASAYDIEDVELMTTLLFISTLAGAFMDVIVDALMVMQAKRDPAHGSQDLVAFQ